MVQICGTTQWRSEMSKMIWTTTDVCVARSQIVFVRDNEDSTCSIFLTNGESFLVNGNAREIAEAAEIYDKPITATRGYFLLVTSENQKRRQYTKIPVVGWIREKTIGVDQYFSFSSRLSQPEYTTGTFRAHKLAYLCLMGLSIIIA
jgi:hypothetical protein